jgi:hypothetical protein
LPNRFGESHREKPTAKTRADFSREYPTIKRIVTAGVYGQGAFMFFYPQIAQIISRARTLATQSSLSKASTFSGGI